MQQMFLMQGRDEDLKTFRRLFGHRYEIVDARWRRLSIDNTAMVVCAVGFVWDGHWSLLLVSLWAGFEWARGL